MEQKFKLREYFKIIDKNVDGNIWDMNTKGDKVLEATTKALHDYAKDHTYGSTKWERTWIEDWNSELDTDEELFLPLDITKDTDLTYPKLHKIVNSLCPYLILSWTAYRDEDGMYNYGSWFKNRHQISIIDIFYKPVGHQDTRVEALSHSIEMGDYQILNGR